MEKSVHSPRGKIMQELLKYKRKSAVLTQAQLAELLDENQSFVAKYEKGDRRLDLIELLEIVEHINYDVPTLIADIDRLEKERHSKSITPSAQKKIKS